MAFPCVCLSRANPSYPLHWCVASRIKDAPELVGNYRFPGDTIPFTCIAVRLEKTHLFFFSFPLRSGLGCGWGWGQAPPSATAIQSLGEKGNVQKGRDLRASFVAWLKKRWCKKVLVSLLNVSGELEWGCLRLYTSKLSKAQFVSDE